MNCPATANPPAMIASKTALPWLRSVTLGLGGASFLVIALYLPAPILAQTAPQMRAIASNSFSRLLFVNPVTGNDTTGDGSGRSPFRTVTRALQSAQPNTAILLAPGTYTAESGEQFPLILPPGTTLQADPMAVGQSIVIQGSGSFAHPTSGTESATVLSNSPNSVMGITLTNPNPRGQGLWVDRNATSLARVTMPNQSLTAPPTSLASTTEDLPSLPLRTFQESPEAVASAPPVSVSNRSHTSEASRFPATEGTPQTETNPANRSLPETDGPTQARNRSGMRSASQPNSVSDGQSPTQPGTLPETSRIAQPPTTSIPTPRPIAPPNRAAPIRRSPQSFPTPTSAPQPDVAPPLLFPSPTAPAAAQPEIGTLYNTGFVRPEAIPSPIAVNRPAIASSPAMRERPTVTVPAARVPDLPAIAPSPVMPNRPVMPLPPIVVRSGTGGSLTSAVSDRPPASPRSLPSAPGEIPPPPRAVQVPVPPPTRSVAAAPAASVAPPSSPAIQTPIEIPVPPPVRRSPQRVAVRRPVTNTASPAMPAPPGRRYDLLPVPDPNAPLGNVGSLPRIAVGGSQPRQAFLSQRAELRYRLVVAAESEEMQSQVRSLEPAAFPVFFEGRPAMQAGVFSTRENAAAAAEMFRQNGFRVIVRELY